MDGGRYGGRASGGGGGDDNRGHAGCEPIGIASAVLGSQLARASAASVALFVARVWPTLAIRMTPARPSRRIAWRRRARCDRADTVTGLTARQSSFRQVWVEEMRDALLLLAGATATNGLLIADLGRPVPRRAACFGGVSALASALAGPALAEEAGPVALTEEQMAARVARKQELLRKKTGGGAVVSGLDVRSDVNPEAGVALRSRSIEDNLRDTLKKQEEMKTRGTKQKRDDMCEMLGRGC